MSDDPIKTALRRACDAAGTADAGIGGEGDPLDAQVAAAAIAAFLRALPEQHMRRKLGPNCYDVDGTTTKRLAAAVERAARDA